MLKLVARNNNDECLPDPVNTLMTTKITITDKKVQNSFILQQNITAR